jgi:hypothetical protein
VAGYVPEWTAQTSELSGVSLTELHRFAIIIEGLAIRERGSARDEPRVRPSEDLAA